MTWGRWGQVAGLPPGASLEDIKAGTDGLMAANRMFGLARSNGANLLVPSSGRYQFELNRSEAYLRGVSGSAASAQVDSGSLGIDFGLRRFYTSLQLSAQSTGFDLRAQGKLTADGRLDGNPVLSDGVTNAAVRGALGGNQGETAGYIFDYRLKGGQSLIGATQWLR